MTGNGNHTTYKNGDDWGMVYGIVLPTWPNYMFINHQWNILHVQKLLAFDDLEFRFACLESSPQEPMPMPTMRNHKRVATPQHQVALSEEKTRGSDPSRLCRQASFHVCMRIAHGQHPAILVPRKMHPFFPWGNKITYGDHDKGNVSNHVERVILHPECTRPPCRCWSRSWTWMLDLWQAPRLRHAICTLVWSLKRFSQGLSDVNMITRMSVISKNGASKNDMNPTQKCIQHRSCATQIQLREDVTRVPSRTLSVHDKVVGFAQVSIVGMTSPGDKSYWDLGWLSPRNLPSGND